MNEIQKAVNYILSFGDFLEEQDKLGLAFHKSSLISTEARKKGNELYTQKNHNQIIHKAILFQYTKSIAFAPRYTEELPLAYSNRSALLLHLKRYKESLIDAHHALTFTKSKDLKAKLEARQRKCAEVLGDKVDVIVSGLLKNLYAGGKIELACTEEKIGTKLELPKIKPSSTLPSASKSVRINYNDTFGRHLIATQNIKPGKVILIEKGYVCFPKNSQLYLVCSHCLQFLWNVISCIHCPYAVYCSEACRYEAWQEYHDEECRILPYLYYEKDDNNTDVKVIARMIIKVLKKEGLDAVLKQAKITYNINSDDFGGLLLDGTLDSNRFWSCYNLTCHPQESRKNKSNNYFDESLVVYLLYELTKLVSNESNVESMNIVHGHNQYYKVNQFDGKILIQLRNILVRLRDILDINSQGYQAYLCSCPTVNDCSIKCDSNRGKMIASCSSLLNHSCSPNVSKMFLPKGRIVIFTTAPIKEGEQILDSYGPVFLTGKKERQAHLKKAFHFTCKCIPCKENWSPTSNLELYSDSRVEAVIQLKMLSQLKKSFSDEETSFFFNEAVDQWKFDKKTLKYAKKWIKLIYTHYNKREAFMQSLSHKVYIDTAFYKLYGEQCIVPNDCY